MFLFYVFILCFSLLGVLVIIGLFNNPFFLFYKLIQILMIDGS